MEKKKQDDFVLNKELSTAEEQPKGKDADHYTRILVAFTFAACALLILFNVVSGFFPVKSTIEFQSTPSFSQSTVSFSQITSTSQSETLISSYSQSQQTKSSPSYSSTEQPIVSMVYWTPKGSVYHLRRDCSALSRSTNVLSGTVENAHKAGKANVCKICGGS